MSLGAAASNDEAAASNDEAAASNDEAATLKDEAAASKEEAGALNEEDEAALLEGFLSGDEAGLLAFLDAFMPSVRSRVARRRPALRRVHDEMEDEVVATWIEWRASKLVRAGESLAELASRLVTQCAVSERRALKRGARLRKALAVDPTDEAASAEEEVEALQGSAVDVSHGSRGSPFPAAAICARPPRSLRGLGRRLELSLRRSAV
ncbi:MAG: hypothetical protein ACYDCL_12390 [Myxococcales bacterium]